MTPPYPKSWWVDPPHLLAGCYPGAKDPQDARTKLAALLQAGIRTWICLQEPDEGDWYVEPFAPYEPVLGQLAAEEGIEVSCLRFPVRDNDVTTPEQMRAILDAIDGSRIANRPVYLHCWGGHGRTGMVVGCWFVRKGLSGMEALDRIGALRDHEVYLRFIPSPQSEPQRQLVLDWHQHDPATTDRHGDG